MNQNSAFIELSDRCLLRVSGPDAADFLQNVITNDMSRAGPGKILYACLLTPQGQYLHDFFILCDGEDFLLDCEAARVDDLLRRFSIFKLRAKVSFSKIETGSYIYAGGESLLDPRLASLGGRLYAAHRMSDVQPVSAYYDRCIHLGIPCGSLAMTARDTMADVNLDLLDAVAWDKGCFIGQEVAARMHHRNLAKKRLLVVRGQDLKAGEKLLGGGRDAGEIRHVGSTGTEALAQIRLSAFADNAPPLTTPEGAAITVTKPAYLKP